jgi:hypothetical protein
MIQEALRSGEPAASLSVRPASLIAAARVVLVRSLLLLLLAYLCLQVGKQWISIIDVKLQQASGSSSEQRYDDYVAFYAAARLVTEGEGSSIYNLPSIASREEEALGRPAGGSLEDGVLPYFNPPFFAGLLAPLTLLSVEEFVLALFGVVCVLIVASGIAMTRLLELRRWELPFFWAWFLSLGSVTFIGLQSQTSVWPLLGWSLYLLLRTRGRETPAGLSLGLALVKPQLIILLVASLAAARRWILLRAFSAVAILAAVLSVAVSGPEVIYRYPGLLLESASWDRENGIIQANMYGWNGFFARVFGDSVLHQAGTLVAIGVTLLVAVWACRSPITENRSRYLLVAGALICCSLLISVHLYRQDLSLLALAVACGAAYSRRTTGSWGFWPLLGVALWVVQFYGPRIMFNHGVNIQTPMIALVLASLVFALNRNRHPLPTEAGQRSQLLSFEVARDVE